MAGGMDGLSVGVVVPRAAFSREVSVLHASVAALLGPSPAGREDLRLLLDGLSLGFPDLSVVLIVYLSGLWERAESLDSVGLAGERDFGVAAKGTLCLAGVVLLLLLPTPASADVRFGRDVR